MEQSKDSFLDGFWDGSRLIGGLPSNVRDQFEVITSPDQEIVIGLRMVSGLFNFAWQWLWSRKLFDPYNKIVTDHEILYSNRR